MTDRRRLVAVAAACALGISLVSATASSERDPRWNVVVIVTDDQRFDTIPHRPAVMPYLQAAISQPGQHWVVFENAFVNTPVCCPSRATLLTGRYAHEHGVRSNKDGLELDESSTVPAWLDAAGYHTGLVGKYLNGYPFGRGPFVPEGWDRWWGRQQGAVENLYYDYTLIEQGISIRYGAADPDYSTDVLADKAVDFVRSVPSDEPFLLWFAPIAPHAPWIPAPRDRGHLGDLALAEPPSVRERDVSDKPRWVRTLPQLGPSGRADLLEIRRRALETLLALDEAVRSIVDAVSSRGDLDRTVIVFVSDNGYSFGEHGWTRKSCPYEECTRVPLLVRYPPTDGRVERELVSAVDLAPTIAELAGIDPPTPVSGTSLVSLLTDGEDSGRVGRVFSEWVGDRTVPAWWQVRTRAFAYVELVTGESELYDLRRDPLELRNVVGDPANAAIVDRLAASLERFRAS